jgi:hypothetical protein
MTAGPDNTLAQSYNQGRIRRRGLPTRREPAHSKRTDTPRLVTVAYPRQSGTQALGGLRRVSAYWKPMTGWFGVPVAKKLLGPIDTSAPAPVTPVGVTVLRRNAAVPPALACTP